MALNLFELAAKITVDKKDFENDLKSTESMMQKFSAGFNKTLKLTATAATAAATAGVVAFGKLAKSALFAAGELEQGLGGSEAVFGQWAEYIQEKANEAATSMGLSATNFLATANKMGSLLRGVGYSQMDAAALAVKAMQRASDVASIMGISIDSAMESITGAMKGNFTMMDNLGVAINDTTLKAYAASKGWKKAAIDQMTTAEKVGLAMELFLEKTAYAEGNYAKENETLAGSITTLKAAWNNFLSGAGGENAPKILAESISNTADIVVNNLNAIIPRLTNGLTTVMKTLGDKLPDLMKTLMPGLQKGIETLIDLLAQALPYLLETAVNLLPAIVEGIASIFVSVGKRAPEILKGLWEGLKEAGSKVGEMLFGKNGENIKWPTDGIKSFEDAINAIKTAWETLSETIRGKAIDFISGFSGKDPEEVAATFDKVAKAVVALGSGLAVFAIGKKITSIVTAITSLMSSGFSVSHPVLLAISALVTAGTLIYQNWDGIAEFFTNLWDTVTKAAEDAWTAVSEWVTGKVVEPVKEAWDTVTAKIKGIVDSAKAAWGVFKLWFQNSIITPVKDKWDEVTEKVSAIVESVKEAWNAIVEWFQTNIIAPISGAWDNITGAVQGVVSAVEGIWSGIVEWFQSSIIDPIIGAWNSVVGAVESAINKAKEFLGLGVSGSAEEGWSPDDPLWDWTSHNAKGMAYVPYDNYVSRLHRGEMILNKSRADDYREGRTGSLEAMTSAITAAVRAGMQGVNYNFSLDGEKVAHNTTDRQRNDQMAWRFAVT